MDILPLLNEMQSLARTGLAYADNAFDRERYERLVELASQYCGQMVDLQPQQVRQRLQSELGHVTPKLGGDAAIFDSRGHILLMRRTDDGKWCLPCGYAEPNEAPRDTAVREVREETGLEVRATRLVDVFTRYPSAENGPHTIVSAIYLCEVVGGEMRLSNEGSDLQYWPIDAVDDWHRDHAEFAAAAHKVWREYSRGQATEEEICNTETESDAEIPEEGAKPQRLSRAVIHESPWVNLYADKVKFPDGRVIEKHYLVDFDTEAVAALVENDIGEILLIQSYRYTTDSIEWEIPAGGIDAGESVPDAARREVFEETGYEIDLPERVYTYNPMNGISNKVFHIVRCKAVKLTGDFDRNEVKGFRWHSIGEIKEKIRARKIRDGFSLTALLLHLNEGA